MPPTQAFLDANESVFFSRQLEHIKSQVIETEYTEMKARTLIPVSTEANPGAEYISWRQFDKQGRAKFIRDWAKDIPRVDVTGVENLNNPIRSLAAGFGYNVQEIRAAGYTGFPLDVRRAIAARETILREENEVAFLGDADFGFVGLFYLPNITQVVLAADGAGGSIAFADKTVDQILRDMNIVPNTIVSGSKGIEKPDTMLLPYSVYNLVSTKRIGIDSNMTVLKYFLSTNPYITGVEPLVELEGAGANGADRMIVYKRDPQKLSMEIPMDVMQHPPEREGLAYTVALESRFGGVLVYKPKSLAYADGI